MPTTDFVVIGAGLAGACAALALSDHGSVIVIESDEPASGGSGVAAGMVNPILGMRARPVWRIAEAVDALERLITSAGAEDLYRRGPTLRPAYGTEQIDRFHRTAREYPEHALWLSPEECAARYSCVKAPEGALLITTGGAIDLRRLVNRILAVARRRGAEVTTGLAAVDWDDEGVTLEDGQRVSTTRTVLALGPGYARFPELLDLRLHQIKGQTIRLTRPPRLPDDLPHLAGRGYVAHDDDSLIAGSTYEHEFEHLEPTARSTAAILRKTRRMLPALEKAELIEARAGVRVTVPGIRLPMVGPLPGRSNVWIFTGFGAKGLLTAPLAARELRAYFDDPNTIPKETRVRPAS